MRWPARRWVRWMLAGLAAALVALLGAFAWLVTTEAGLERAVALVESVGSVRIRVDGARGRLIGPLAIDAIEIEHPRARIRIAGLSADYEPSGLFAGRIAAEAVRVEEAEVALRPAAGPAKPPSFMPGWLVVAIEDAAVSRLLLVSPEGTQTRFSDIRGSATLSKSRIEFEGVHARSPGWAVAGASGSLLARRPIALDVTAAWSLADERVAGVVHAAGDLDRVLADARVATPGLARVKAEVTKLGPGLEFRGEASVEALDLSQWIEEPPVGPLAGTLAFEGDRARYRAHGTLLGRGLPEAGVPVALRASYADRVLTFESIDAEPGPASTVHAAGTMRFADEPAYDVSASWTRFRWPLTGRALVTSPRGSLEAEGWKEFSYLLRGEFAAPAGPPFAGSAAGRFTRDAIAVERSDWRSLGGRVSLAGSLGRDAAKRWSVSGRAVGIDPSQLRAELPGRLSFDFAGSGAGFGADGPWAAKVSRLGGRFRGQPVSGGGSVRRAPGRTELEDVAIALGPSRLEADGVLSRHADLEARAVSDDLSAVLPGLGGRLNATVLVREHTIALGITGHDLAWGSHRAVVLSADAHVDRDGREHSWLRLRSSGITLAGFPINDTRLSLNGLPRDHALTLRIGSGQDAVSVRGRGSWDGARYGLGLSAIDASGPRIAPWQLESATRLTAGFDAAALEPLCLVYESRRVCAEGRWQSGGEWSAEARTDSFPLRALDSKRVGAPRFRGLLVFDARASGRAGSPWVADVKAEVRDAALVYKSSSGADRTVVLGDTRLVLASDAERHRLDLRVSDTAELELAANLEATRTPGAAFGDLPVRGTVEGRTRQVGLLPLLVDAVDNAAGELALDFRVAGQVARPVLEGEARLSQGALDFYQANLRLRDLRSTLRLQDTTLTLDADGKAGDGSLTVKGRLGWRDRKLDGELVLAGERLLVANVPEARVYASPDLVFSLDDRRIRVTGEVAIPEARIQPADTAGAVLASSDERIVRPDAGAPGGEPFEVTSEVRLSLGEKVSVKAYGLTATVTGAVTTHMAPRESATGSGELQVKEGEYKAYGRELEVERGRLVFSGGPVTDPAVDLRATQEVPGYKVGVIARGPLRRPQLTLFSEPGLPQAQIASMLIVGRSSLQGEPGSTEGGVDPAASGGAFLAGQLGKYVGLDDVGLAQEAGSGTELVLGKYLSPRLYVSYGISLVDEINTLKLRYTIGDRWVISAESGRESAADVEYRIED